MGINLILSNNFNSINSSDEILYVSQFNADLINQNFLSKNIYSICKPVSTTKNERQVNLVECDKIYESIIGDVANSLNNLHDVNYSKKEWEIMIGMWLKKFVWSCYHQYKLLKNAIINYKIDRIHLLEDKNYKLYTKETVGLHNAIFDDEWCNILLAKIFKLLNLKIYTVLSNPTNNHLKNQETYHEYTNDRTTLKKKLLSLISWTTTHLKSSSDAVIINTNFKFWTEKKLELYLNQIPKYWIFPKINYGEYEEKERLKIDINKTGLSEIETIIRKILPESIPMSSVENFNEIDMLESKLNLPKNPKFIFTSMEHQFNEIFKKYIVKKQTNLYIGQHGQGQYSHFINNYLTDKNISAKQILWGAYPNNKKNIPAFNFKIMGKKRNYKQNGVLTIISRGFSVRSSPYDTYIDDKLHLKNTSKVIDGLQPEIKKKIFFKTHPANCGREINLLKRFIQNKDINFTDNQNEFEKIMKKTQLSFFNNDSTLFLENLALNMPSVMYWHDPFKYLNDDACDFYQLLLNSKIIFKDIDKLISHINEYWQNIESWWFNTSTQESIAAYNKAFNMLPNKNSLKNLSKELSL